MATSKKQFPLFFGSTVVLGCFLGMMGSSGSMLFTSMGVLIKPLSEEFGWARDEISYGATLITFGIIIGLLTSGFLIDRFGARRVLIISVILSIIVVATGPCMSLACHCFIPCSFLPLSSEARLIPAVMLALLRAGLIGVVACSLALTPAVWVSALPWRLSLLIWR